MAKVELNSSYINGTLLCTRDFQQFSIFRLTKATGPSSRIYGSGREVDRRSHRLRRRSGREPDVHTEPERIRKCQKST
jgi:hypothetical protein